MTNWPMDRKQRIRRNPLEREEPEGEEEGEMRGNPLFV